MFDVERGGGWHDEEIKPTQLHEKGSFAETQSDEIPTSPENEEIKAQQAQDRAERNAEALAEAQEAARKAAA